MSDINVLSVRQPWAGFIMAERKSIECRNWSPRKIEIGDRLYIHAAGKADRFAIVRFGRDGYLSRVPEEGWDITTRGAILGYVTYNGIRKYQNDNHFYSDSIFHLCRPVFNKPTKFGLILEHPVRFWEPLFKRGKLGIFTIPGHLVEGRAEMVPRPSGKLTYPEKEAVHEEA